MRFNWTILTKILKISYKHIKQFNNITIFTPIMISYIKGSVAECMPTHVIVEASGLGYYIHISLHTYSKINGQANLKILTHLITREDGQTLYGFAQDDERSLFIHLISVSGWVLTRLV